MMPQLVAETSVVTWDVWQWWLVWTLSAMYFLTIRWCQISHAGLKKFVKFYHLPPWGGKCPPPFVTLLQAPHGAASVFTENLTSLPRDVLLTALARLFSSMNNAHGSIRMWQMSWHLSPALCGVCVPCTSVPTLLSKRTLSRERRRRRREARGPYMLFQLVVYAAKSQTPQTTDCSGIWKRPKSVDLLTPEDISIS